MSNKEKIKEILSPHFGYLNLYLKWSEECGVKKIEEIHEFVKSNKELIKKLPKSLNQYSSYYSAMSDIYQLQKDTKLQRSYKDGLTSKSRKFFNETFDRWKGVYIDIYEDDFKFDMFLRSSSKPQTMREYMDYVKSIHMFDSEMSGLITKIENEFDHLRTSKGAYLFKMDTQKLDIVPSIWCIKNDPEQFEDYLMGFNSIWLLVDPFCRNKNRRIVGIDVEKNLRDILYMDSLNNRFEDNVPITSQEFFHLTRNRLNKEEVTDDIGKVLESHGLDVNYLIQKILESEEQKYQTYQENEYKTYDEENNEAYRRLKRLFGG